MVIVGVFLFTFLVGIGASETVERLRLAALDGTVTISSEVDLSSRAMWQKWSSAFPVMCSLPVEGSLQATVESFSFGFGTGKATVKRGLPLIPEMKLTGGEPQYFSGFDGNNHGGPGFHKKLVMGLTLPEHLYETGELTDEDSVLIVQPLPLELFADSEQLKQSRAVSESHLAYASPFVDLEGEMGKTEGDPRSVVLFTCKPKKRSCSGEVMVHGRYLPPARTGEKLLHTVELPPPCLVVLVPSHVPSRTDDTFTTEAKWFRISRGPVNVTSTVSDSFLPKARADDQEWVRGVTHGIAVIASMIVLLVAYGSTGRKSRDW